MYRGEVAAIEGAYSRQGFTAVRVPGGFLIDNADYRTIREARRDTGVDWSKFRMLRRANVSEYIGQHGRIIA
jgi:hypothetical protein